MSRLPIRSLMLAGLLGLTVSAHAIVPMGDLHCNDSQGRPAPPYTVGTPVTVSGIVTAGTGTFTAARTEVFVQDATGAVMIFDYTVPATFASGDSVTFSGLIDQYRGQTEVTLDTWTNHGGGYPPPEPRVLTCEEVTNQFGPDYCEPEESMLVLLERVTYTGTWGANQLVTLQDESGTCDMWIDGDTGVGSIPPPEGHFDVIAVLKQYDGFSPPFTNGYEVLPRMPSDIIPRPGPGIIEGPIETDMLPDRVTIVWTTDVPATTRVDYGYTIDYELGTITDTTLVTEHAVTLTGLEPATVYLYRVVSSNDEGETSIPGLRFCSGSRSAGQIDVYFNKSVDTSLALGEDAQGNADLEAILIARIDAAQSAIDVALYSFDLSGPADALIAAYQRGVEVRFITENRDNMQEQVARLIQAGITVIDDAYGPDNSGDGLMHDKFWVFDHRLDDDPSDDWVLTGSWNITNQGTNTDMQNVILIQDESLAEIYTAEIDEMWGSSDAVPDPNNSRFGSRKLDDTPKHFLIGGLPARLYFGPSDHTMAAISERISESERSVHFAVLSFTRYDVGNAMQERFYNVPDFAVRGVFDSAESGNTSSEYHEMIGGGDYPWDPPADVWLDGETGSLHHKYMILDVNDNAGRPTVITGSSNWSNSANNSNDENIVMIEDFRLANLYFQEFSERYHNAGGSADLTVGAPETVDLPSPSVRSFPNPAHPTITIQLAPTRTGLVRVSLHDLAGRRLETREVEVTRPGNLSFDWDLRNRPVGIYFLRFSGAGIEARRRITLLR